MRIKRLTAIVMISVLCFSAVMVSGCTTGSTNVSPTPTPAGAPTATPTAAATPTPLPPATATPSVSTPTTGPATPTPYPWGNDSAYFDGVAELVKKTGYSGNSQKSLLPDSLDYSIVITGGTVSPVTLTWADLKAMDMVRMNADMMKHGSITPVTSEWVGIPTTDILAKAGLPEGSLTIKMTAADGFETTYAPDQLQGTMLGLIKNGTALDTDIDGDNPIQLVVPGAYGSSWIKVPTQISISTS